MQFYNWITATNNRKAAILFFSIILITTIIAFTTLTAMYRMTRRLYQPLEESNTLREQFMQSDSIHRDISADKIKYLKLEYGVLSKFKEHHKETGRVYYTNYYSFTVVLSFTAVITAVLIFMIANNGWQQANILMKVSFCTFFAISSFFGLMTVTLGQKENYENNFKQYLYYDKIQSNIITFIHTYDQYEPTRANNLADSFIVAVNNDLRDNDQFFLSIDANKVSIEDISSKMGKALNNK